MSAAPPTEGPERSEGHFGWRDGSPTCAHSYLLPALLQALEDLARARGRPALRIVDLGCGNGFVAGRLADLGHEVVGLDAAQDGIDIARQQDNRAHFVVGSIYDARLLELVGGTADCVVSLEVIEHLFRPVALFEAAAAILRPNGRLLVSAPYHGYVKNLALSLVGGWDRHFDSATTGGHIKFFSPRTLKAMAERSGFVNARLRGLGRVPGLWKSMLLSADAPPSSSIGARGAA